MEMKDFQIRILRHLEPLKYRWNMCVQVSYRGEVIDTEQVFISTYETATGVNMELHIKIDQLRREFEAIL